MSIGLHGHSTLEGTFNIDTRVQEKAITYPAGSKSAIKIINRPYKLPTVHGIQQRLTYVKEEKSYRLGLQHFLHAKNGAKPNGH